jgi:F-type H+-transporting ATPase subunit epsilon
VTSEHVEVLADAAELSHQIDLERARQARERAEELLRKSGGEDIDVERAAAALARALNRLKVAEERGG